MTIQRLAAVLALFVLTLPIDGARAQVERSGGGVNAQLAQQYQLAIAERTKLQAENAQLKRQLEDATKQLQASVQQLKSAKQGAAAVRAVEAQLAAAQAASQNSAHSLEQLKSKSEELVSHFRDTVATLKGVESERAQLRQELLQAKAARDQCAERNYQLFQINAEVLDRYQHQGIFGRVAAAEPFTGIARTRIDNLVLEDRQRVEQLRVERQKDTAIAPGVEAAEGSASLPVTTPAATPAVEK